jgi:hypothetical protein
MNKYSIEDIIGNLIFQGDFNSLKDCVEGAVRKGVSLKEADS